MPGSDKTPSIHSGHRQRLGKTALEAGIDELSDIQALELLLFYPIPRRDTNELAHRLINHFGSYSAVLNADYHKLLEVDGIGKNAASLLALMPGFLRKYEQDLSAEKRYLLDKEHREKYVRSLFFGKTQEEFYMICLNSQCQLIRTKLLSQGSLDEVRVYPRTALKEALVRETKYVILAHNHPGGNPDPSSHDVNMTNDIIIALKTVGVTVVDHLIVAGGQCFSFVGKGMIKRSSKF